jgi:hypothetical protein
MDNTQEGKKEQQEKGREEAVLTIHMKGMKTNIDDGGGWLSLPLLLAHQNNMRENTYITKKGVNMEQG